jgi:hypothetical protein
LRLHGRGFVGLQGQGEDAVDAVVVETLVELPDARKEITLGQEVQDFPFGIEDGIGVAVIAVGDLGAALFVQRVQEELAGSPPVEFGVGDPPAVGRPRAVGDVVVVALIDLDRLLVVGGDPPQAAELVPVQKFLAGGPDRPSDRRRRPS